jgi:isopenicillin-N N-acyltransferase-like protein
VFSGGAYERGYQYGTKFSQNIDEMLNRSYQFYNTIGRLPKDKILKVAGKFIPYIQEYSNEIAEELRGIAEGSGKMLEEITLLTAFNEMQFYYGFVFARSAIYGKLIGCTSFCATSEATKDGETYICQNNDGSLSPNFDEYNFLMKSKTDSGVEFLTLTIMGTPSFIGLNSKGIALCINAVSDGEYRIGVPFAVITREILGSKTLGDAVNAVIRADRGTGANYLMADEHGECYDIETTARRFNCIYVDKTFGHSNHYLIQNNIRDDVFLRMQPSTIIRYNRINRLLNRNIGKIDIEKCFDFLKDHLGQPYSICVHPNEEQPIEMRMKTMDSVVMVPSKRELWIARDNPCRVTFRRYTLNST